MADWPAAIELKLVYTPPRVTCPGRTCTLAWLTVLGGALDKKMASSMLFSPLPRGQWITKRVFRGVA
ncbi:hypothetical protein GUJ93_ZPchr0013g37164 [Zizania palustris]|uniref:Uncharacterized protein n=1 Tax=Zizania palustris TaxID=103762 RepID=A0A8J6BTU6_ZIZPA|nr:hypothetical protein GUJ93_ZPchr0013g37164 [Zizania palustris]